ncbi:MAG TPA: formylmethanofuran dehydrogenase subunit C [Methanospirillum sp.]|uniref:formylmethanofuran dehydrogenase subunit C n=2 Tax=Methanospirillum sp. TaxID=45200 RepID=UPI002BD011F6|nr:formylmethanofuran dehydrogenase subunit C [Methanospirillum sp.]HOJ97536.1 formylmethanofuran dehydrogenase subunit C [Methanospirillum sp.]
MMQVTLTMKPRAKPFLPIEAEMIIPMNFIGNRELFVWEGNKKRRLEEVFTVRKEGNVNSPENIVVILRGDTSRVKRVGEYMSSGTIIIEGDIGMHCGNFMRGGNIVIHGNADGWLGREMRAGSILCHGNAGDYCGSGYRGEKRGMRGGKIEVMGNAGDYLGEYLTGGEIHVHGNAGMFAGAEMRGGMLIIDGDVRIPAANMSKGTCIVGGTVIDMLPTFERIGEKEGMVVYHGDIANKGKGELMVKKVISTALE